MQIALAGGLFVSVGYAVATSYRVAFSDVSLCNISFLRATKLFRPTLSLIVAFNLDISKFFLFMDSFTQL